MDILLIVSVFIVTFSTPFKAYSFDHSTVTESQFFDTSLKRDNIISPTLSNVLPDSFCLCSFLIFLYNSDNLIVCFSFAISNGGAFGKFNVENN